MPVHGGNNQWDKAQRLQARAEDHPLLVRFQISHCRRRDQLQQTTDQNRQARNQSDKDFTQSNRQDKRLQISFAATNHHAITGTIGDVESQIAFQGRRRNCRWGDSYALCVLYCGFCRPHTRHDHLAFGNTLRASSRDGITQCPIYKIANPKSATISGALIQQQVPMLVMLRYDTGATTSNERHNPGTRPQSLPLPKGQN